MSSVEHFVTRFGRLITEADRLATDFSSVAKGNGHNHREHRHTTALNGAIAAFRERGECLVKQCMRAAELEHQLPVPFIQLDSEARIVHANKECRMLLEPTGSPVLGKLLSSFLSYADGKLLRDYMADSNHSSKPFTIPVSLTQKTTPLPVHLRIRKSRRDQANGYVAVILNASEKSHRTRTHHNGSSIEVLLHSFVLDLSHASTLAAAVPIVRRYSEKAFASFAGMIFMEHDGQAQLISQWPSEKAFAGKLSLESIRKGPISRSMRTGTPIFWSYPGTNRDLHRNYRGRSTEKRSLIFAALPIRSAEGRATAVLGLVISHDHELIPESREHMAQFARSMAGFMERAGAYDEAIAARSAAEDSNKRQADLLSMISHELRNPMTPILNWALVLSSGRLSTEKQGLAIEAIVRNVRALNYLIDDLFDVARISSGKLRLDPVKMSIQDAAREALAATQQAAESKKLRVTTDIAEGIPAFFADPRRVRQIFINLLNNAVKFTPGGGVITLKVRQSGAHVECAVRDTGKGIAPKFLPFVFERFRQENRPSKAKMAGLGLGLAIVREIVELHGGTVRAHSQGMNLGSTFIFRLPLKKHSSLGAVQ